MPQFPQHWALRSKSHRTSYKSSGSAFIPRLCNTVIINEQCDQKRNNSSSLVYQTRVRLSVNIFWRNFCGPFHCLAELVLPQSHRLIPALISDNFNALHFSAFHSHPSVLELRKKTIKHEYFRLSINFSFEIRSYRLGIPCTLLSCNFRAWLISWCKSPGRHPQGFLASAQSRRLKQRSAHS